MENGYICRHSVGLGSDISESHFHDGYEIIYSDTSGIRFFINNKVYNVEKGDLLVLNNRALHKPIVPRDLIYDRRYIVFEPSYIRDFSTEQTDLLRCFENRVCCLDEGQRVELKKLFSHCQREENEEYGSDIMKRIALIKLLVFVNKCFSHVPKINHSLKGDTRVREIQKYISENPHENLSLSALSLKFYLSQRHLELIFKDYCGFSVGEYVTGVRIITAKELLSVGVSVSQAGERSGYPNPSHFSRVFKQHTGLSPRNFQKSLP